MTPRLWVGVVVLLAACDRAALQGGRVGTTITIDGGAGGHVGSTSVAGGGVGGGSGGARGGAQCGDLTVACSAPSQFCESPVGDCGKMIVAGARCQQRPTICTTEYDPVCGCDGQTYGSDCERRAAGVSGAAIGACDGNLAPCFANTDCKEGLFCELAAGGCRRDVRPQGTCLARPRVCDEVYRPVCGCDGTTYGNDCWRQVAGVPKLSEGVCSQAAACPAGAAARDVCGCGCCGEPKSRACYYPALGQSASTIPDPLPPVNCALAGCSAGVRYVCCADPGVPAGGGATASYCVFDTAMNNGEVVVTKIEGETCTRLLMIPTGSSGPLVITPGNWDVRAFHGPCAEAGVRAIGSLGSIGFRRVEGKAFLDLHAALFFDDGSGTVARVRMDVDALAFDLFACAR